MKYLLLAYLDQAGRGTSSADERAALEAVNRASDEALREGGYLLAALDFQDNDTALRVRVQEGQLSLEDGPMTETNERLVGLFFIQARDLNEAIRVAAGMPQARRGSIEVRGVPKFGNISEMSPCRLAPACRWFLRHER